MRPLPMRLLVGISRPPPPRWAEASFLPRGLCGRLALERGSRPGTQHPELKLRRWGLKTMPSFSLRMRSRGSPGRLCKDGALARAARALATLTLCSSPTLAPFSVGVSDFFLSKFHLVGSQIVGDTSFTSKKSGFLWDRGASLSFSSSSLP
jgi:hypothetical protein